MVSLTLLLDHTRKTEPIIKGFMTPDLYINRLSISYHVPQDTGASDFRVRCLMSLHLLFLWKDALQTLYYPFRRFPIP